MPTIRKQERTTIFNPATSQGIAYRRSSQNTAPQEISYDLTRKEMQVLQHLAKGESNREISNQLCRSIRTVECHVATILGKLGVKNRVMAAMIFMTQFAMLGGNDSGA